MVRVIDLDAGVLRRAHENFWLDLDEVSPGAGLDGREQVVFSENRRWIGQLDFVRLRADALRRAQVIGDQLRGRVNHLRVTLCNPGLFRPRTSGAAFLEALGVPTEDIDRGYLLFAEGAGFEGGTGFALPDFVDPVVASDAPAGAAALVLEGMIASLLVPGSFFSIDDFLHRVEANEAGTLSFNPPLRQAVAAGAVARVVFPQVRVRLADKKDWRPFGEYLRFGRPMTVNVVEAFDR